MDETDTRTLADFLLARIAEDEIEARSYVDQPYGDRYGVVSACDCGEDHAYSSYLVVDPAFALAECAVKRRVVEPWAHPSLGDEEDWRYGIHAEAHTVVLRLLALPYAGHPDYLTDWRP